MHQAAIQLGLRPLHEFRVFVSGSLESVCCISSFGRLFVFCSWFFFSGSNVLRNDSASHCVLDHELVVLKAMMTFVRREEQVLGGVMGFGNSNVSSACADSGAFLHDV